MTDDSHVAQGASYFELKSCSKAFGEIDIFLFLMTAIYYIVLPLFVLIGNIHQTCPSVHRPPL